MGTSVGPQPVPDFAAAIEAARCTEVHETLGRCGFLNGHDRPQHGVAVLEGRTLALHLWVDGEVRRVEPGQWGMSKQRLPWAAGYWFDEPPRA